MGHTSHSERIFGKVQNGHIQNSKEMGTMIVAVFKGIGAAIVPFFLLAIGLATLQMWALLASIFSAGAIGCFHLYKLFRMLREDIRCGKKPNPFRRRKNMNLPK